MVHGALRQIGLINGETRSLELAGDVTPPAPVTTERLSRRPFPAGGRG